MNLVLSREGQNGTVGERRPSHSTQEGILGVLPEMIDMATQLDLVSRQNRRDAYYTKYALTLLERL